MQEAFIAVTGDHGESLGKNGVHWHHGRLYPQNLHVPMILAWPGSPRGRRESKPVQNLGIGRTLLDLAGLEHIDFGGHNMLDGLPEGRTGDAALFAIEGNGVAASITEDGWHLMLELRTHFTDPMQTRVIEAHSVALYSLEEDPLCRSDRSETDHARARRMRAKLLAWLQGTDARGWRIGEVRDRGTLAHLSQLGYVTDSLTDLDRDWIDPDCQCESCVEFGVERSIR
jgi:arylsulfatase A-like enzyme